MKIFNRMTVLGALTALVSLSGCVIPGPGNYRQNDRGRDRGQYTYDHGDRIDRSGHRDVGWCGHHRDDSNCHR